MKISFVQGAVRLINYQNYAVDTRQGKGQGRKVKGKSQRLRIKDEGLRTKGNKKYKVKSTK
jgi:hypothetical protein